MRAALLWLLVVVSPVVWAQESPLLKRVEPDYGKYDELQAGFQVVTAQITLSVLPDGTPYGLEKSSIPLPRAVVDALKEYQFRPQAAPFGIEFYIPVRSKVPLKSAGPAAAAPPAPRGKATRGPVTKRVAPIYPPEAKQRRIQGKVVLAATITKEGKISNLRAVSGPLLLMDAARTAVSQWEYKPYLLDKEPVEVETDIDVVFSLN